MIFSTWVDGWTIITILWVAMAAEDDDNTSACAETTRVRVRCIYYCGEDSRAAAGLLLPLSRNVFFHGTEEEDEEKNVKNKRRRGKRSRRRRIRRRGNVAVALPVRGSHNHLRVTRTCHLDFSTLAEAASPEWPLSLLTHPKSDHSETGRNTCSINGHGTLRFSRTARMRGDCSR